MREREGLDNGRMRRHRRQRAGSKPVCKSYRPSKGAAKNYSRGDAAGRWRRRWCLALAVRSHDTTFDDKDERVEEAPQDKPWGLPFAATHYCSSSVTAQVVRYSRPNLLRFRRCHTQTKLNGTFQCCVSGKRWVYLYTKVENSREGNCHPCRVQLI